jgi:hypothetical protein
MGSPYQMDPFEVGPISLDEETKIEIWRSYLSMQTPNMEFFASRKQILGSG